MSEEATVFVSPNEAMDEAALTDAFGKLTRDLLTATVSVYQRKHGHRYSIDDVLTAHEALPFAHGGERYIDLGCGIGSVLLSVASTVAQEQSSALISHGIEAQSMSYELARRNIEDSPINAALHHGDFRKSRPFEARSFPLVTGTPPYAPLSDVTPSPDSQRLHARVEMRGGVEAYLDAADHYLADGGTAVICGAEIQRERLEAHAPNTSLSIVKRLDVVPRIGKARLFCVWTLQRLAARSRNFEITVFNARDQNGERSDVYHAVRERFGFERSERS